MDNTLPEIETLPNSTESDRIYDMLWLTFLTEGDGWFLRQFGTYREFAYPLTGREEIPTEDDMNFLDTVIETHYKKLLFTDKAYKFPDSFFALTALYKLNGDSDDYKCNIAKLGIKLRRFCSIEVPKAKGFILNIQEQTCQIYDHDIDPTDLLEEWRKFEISLGINTEE